ncbi:MAG TPA: hypothetical protein VF736_18975 [Pyrinomonadaceae bacterium]|jgi:hypothetical protein
MHTVKSSVITLLAIALAYGLTPSAPAASAAAGARTAPAAAPGKKVKDFKVKKGPEVAARVRALRESSENVRAALRYFERKGRPPQIDESFSMSGSYGSGRAVASNRFGAVFMPAAFAPQDQSSLSDGTVEIIFVPDYSVEAEWQGTVIANRYDEYGNLAEQYVSQTVMTAPDPSVYSWDEIYEAPVYGGEVQEPVSEPGMYSGYNWGSTREEQPMMYQYETQTRKDGPAARDGVRVVKAGYAAQTRRARIRAWARCSFAWCGGAAVACVGVNIWNAELLAGPCFAAACGASAIGCTWGTIWQ